MSVLIIGPAEERKINDAIQLARANTIPLRLAEMMGDDSPKAEMLLRDRKPGATEIRGFYPPQQIMLGTYRASFSFEEQPAGLMRHLSVSSKDSRMIPGVPVMVMVAEAFGFTGFPPKRIGRIWVEEFEPGHRAVNVVELDTNEYDQAH
jgi:hypothetical protein